MNIITAIKTVLAFTGLTDAPSSYSGQALNLVRVNAGENALEFTPATVAGISNIVEDTTPQLGGDLDANGNDIIAGDIFEIRGNTVSTDSPPDNATLLSFQQIPGANEYLKIRNWNQGDTDGNFKLEGPSITAIGPGDDTPFDLKVIGPEGERSVIQMKSTQSLGNQNYSWLRVTNGAQHEEVIVEAWTEGASHAPLSLKSKGTDSIRMKWSTTTLGITGPELELIQLDTTGADAGPHISLKSNVLPANMGAITTANPYRVGAIWGLLLQPFLRMAEILFESTNGGAGVETGRGTFRSCVAGTANVVQGSWGNGFIIGTTTVMPGSGKLRVDGIELGHDTDTSLSRVSAGIGAVEGHQITVMDTENQPLTGGVTVTEKDLGTVSSGTTTLDMGDRPMHKYTNGGAHTLAPGSTIGSTLIAITNNASAGAITTSGWTKVAGDSFTTTDAHKFLCSGSVSAVGSLLTVQAMQ